MIRFIVSWEHPDHSAPLEANVLGMGVSKEHAETVAVEEFATEYSTLPHFRGVRIPSTFRELVELLNDAGCYCIVCAIDVDDLRAVCEI